MADRYIEWIRDGLRQPGKTQTGLARQLGIAHPQITRLMKGERRLKADEIDRVAAYLGTRPPLGDLVPVVGFVRAGGETILYDEGQGPFAEAPMPYGGNSSTVAVEVKGDSMTGRVEDGDLVYYDDRHDPPSESLFGRLCVVGLADGRVMVKKLLKGSQPGLFHLLSVMGDPILDARVDWAARVVAIHPR